MARIKSPSKATSKIEVGRAVNLSGVAHEATKKPVAGVCFTGAEIGEHAIIDTDEFVRACVGENVAKGDELTAYTGGKFFKAGASEFVAYTAWESGSANQTDVLLHKAGYYKPAV
jgi:hypothetical protein